MNFGEVFNMKKRIYFLMMVLVSLFFCSCEFMCVKEVRDTYLLIDDVDTSDIRVFCESEKLEVIKSTECIFVSDDEHFSYLKNKNLIDDNNTYKIFYIPTGFTIDDHTNVNIFFQVDIEGENYTGELFIDTLYTKKENDIDKFFFKLKSKDGKILSAIFTFKLHLSL